MHTPLHHGQNASLPEAREYTVKIPDILTWAIQELFIVSLVTYLIFYLIDVLLDSFVSKQFNMNIVLWIVIISGMLSVFLNPHPENSAVPNIKKTVTVPMVVWIVTLGVVAAGVVMLKTRSLGRLGYMIAGISGALVVLLSFVLLFEDEHTDTHPEQ